MLTGKGLAGQRFSISEEGVGVYQKRNKTKDEKNKKKIN